MSDVDHAQITADEAAVEKHYSDALATRARNFQANVVQGIRNTFTGGGAASEMPKEARLVGRVALIRPNEDFLDGERTFYIGTSHHVAPDYEVFSWAAPVSCTFYRGASDHHPLCDEVAGVRVLAHRAGVLVDHQDQSFTTAPAESLFPRRELLVPKAPTGASQPVFAASTPREADPSGSSADEADPQLEKTIPARPVAASSLPEPELRTPELLRRQLAAPKTVSMGAVLATLQADQYESITRPVAESQILQGHPGTGKTIIAAHRAAYLLNSEAPESAKPKGDRHVLILGPTAEWVRHVQGALRELIDDPTRYVVQSIPALLENLAGLPESTFPTESVELQNVSLDLARLVDIALHNSKANVGDEAPQPEDVYSELVWLRHEPPQDGLDAEWAQYLRQLPQDLKELKKRRTRAYLGLLAYIGARTMHTAEPGHVIVDEGQDIHPIEWEILGRLGNVGGWTILGDLNQRRTDHTFNSWDDVAQLLAIEDDTGRAPVRVLENGYRSTAQIIRFANQLLPARDRKLFSLQQSGEHPVVHRAGSVKNLFVDAANAALELMGKVNGGTVALIGPELDGVREFLKKRGWQSEPGDLNSWRKDDAVLRVLPPDRARGLEFDAVVVVEPGAFPENLGRQGVLYTALTRANRFLTVIHHRALPKGMKARP